MSESSIAGSLMKRSLPVKWAYYTSIERFVVLLDVSIDERNAMPRALAAPGRHEGIGQLDRGGGCVIRLLGIDSFNVTHRTSKYLM